MLLLPVTQTLLSIILLFSFMPVLLIPINIHNSNFCCKTLKNQITSLYEELLNSCSNKHCFMWQVQEISYFTQSFLLFTFLLWLMLVNTKQFVICFAFTFKKVSYLIESSDISHSLLISYSQCRKI